MTLKIFSSSLLAVAILSSISATVIANEEKDAKKLCKQTLRDHYDIQKFRDLWVEQVGNHKFKVHGKAKTNHHFYPFDCNVKHGHVKSYAYKAPIPDHSGDDDDDSNIGTLIAAGAGLAIIAALAANSDDDDKDSGGSSQLNVKKSILEDDCHDGLQYRIRDEHNSSARVAMKASEIKGYDLKGEAKVKYNNSHPQHVRYTCHFSKRGHLVDSSYHLY